MYFAFQRLTKVAIIFDYSISGAAPCPGGTSVRGIAPDGHSKQVPGAAPCHGGPSARGFCTGWGGKQIGRLWDGKKGGAARVGAGLSTRGPI